MSDRLKSLYEGPYGFERSSVFGQYARNRVLARIVPQDQVAGARLLDVGCNDGAVMEYFKGLVYDVRSKFLAAGGFNLVACHGIALSPSRDVWASLCPGLLAPILIVDARKI